ncbi:PaaX family transcriptional regulator C-terminal domain-containing protein [Nocardia jiangxiensis]|uniref:PaaX family transcriptional regulator C-terminal domain-containing protein n=1 Tax=Nocardia jiangxiensis TaxID=282685 RepID=A0ABW6SBW3_9NOCA
MPDRHLPTIQPLTARSVAISALLGYHPPVLPVSALVKIGELFGIAERTTRVALTRMVADGDVTSADGAYRLTERLVARQEQQERSCSPTPKQWGGNWDIAIVTSSARPLADRVALRKSMIRLRFAELREGVWTRPANLLQQFDGAAAEQCLFFEGRHQHDAALATLLWDLPGWAAEASRLCAELDDDASLVSGFMASAEVLRHLLLDPCLPPELLPADWPGDALRQRYSEFNATYAQRLREYSRSESMSAS